jgi:hypothetical protein
MTREIKIETALSAKASGFRYVRSNNVAVVSVIGERDTPSTSLRSKLHACAARFNVFLRRWLRALPQDRVLLFAITPFSDQHNALSRRRGVWGSEGLRWLPEGVPRSPSVAVTREEGGIRFAGLADVGQAGFFEAADFVRTHAGSFLSVLPHRELTEERVRSTVKRAFPTGESAVDWAGVIEQVEEGEDICIRACGGFDDREASIDAFLSADLLLKLGTP